MSVVARSCTTGALKLTFMPPDAGNAVRDDTTGQAGAVRERITPDAGDTVADCHTGQAGAALERPTFDAGDAVGYRDAGQAGAGRERRVPDAGDRRPCLSMDQHSPAPPIPI